MKIVIRFTNKARVEDGQPDKLELQRVGVVVKEAGVFIFPNMDMEKDPDNPDVDIYPWHQVAFFSVREEGEEKDERKKVVEMKRRATN